MPELDGYEATREIRRLEAGGERRIPIVALTAHALTGADLESKAAGMDAHISKPIDRRACRAAWSSTLAPRTRRPPNWLLSRVVSRRSIGSAGP